MEQKNEIDALWKGINTLSILSVKIEGERND